MHFTIKPPGTRDLFIQEEFANLRKRVISTLSNDNVIRRSQRGLAEEEDQSRYQLAPLNGKATNPLDQSPHRSA